MFCCMWTQEREGAKFLTPSGSASEGEISGKSRVAEGKREKKDVLKLFSC